MPTSRRRLLAAGTAAAGSGLLPAAAQAPPAAPAAAPVPDPRHLSNGWVIPSEGYADQPYVVRTADGAWLCVITTGRGREGEPGQHVVTRRSTDRGRTWGPAVDVEPASGPEASYAVLLRTPGGRIFCFYNHNTDNVREVRREDGGVYRRVDSLGHFVFKYSDDHGRSWSERRYEIPVREFECDRRNIYGGKLRFFWNVGRAFSLDGAAYVPLHKVGAMGAGFFAQSEGVLLRSPDLLTQRDPAAARWETLPEGDVGLRTPPGGGRVAEEQSFVPLGGDWLFVTYRSVDGYPVESYSPDRGRTWQPPQYRTYEPGGRRFKHPRAANFVWPCSNGKVLYWFHNHGGSAAARQGPAPWDPYADRNPAWLCAGEVRATPAGPRLFWTQPEILLYDDDPYIRMSYPDLIEEDGRFWITETQKNVGRVHEIPPALLEGLFGQFSARSEVRDGLLLDSRAPRREPAALPPLPEFHRRDTGRPDYGGRDLRAGLTLDLWLDAVPLPPGRLLAGNRTPAGHGFELRVVEEGAAEIVLSDGREEARWRSDPGTLSAGRPHHLCVIVDGGPKLILFVADGVLLDGGERRQFGWGRYSPTLRSAAGLPTVGIDPAVRRFRLYGRALRVSEAVSQYRAGG